ASGVPAAAQADGGDSLKPRSPTSPGPPVAALARGSSGGGVRRGGLLRSGALRTPALRKPPRRRVSPKGTFLSVRKWGHFYLWATDCCRAASVMSGPRVESRLIENSARRAGHAYTRLHSRRREE